MIPKFKSTRGTNNTNSKLNEQIVKDIRQDYANDMKQCDIATKYGIARGTVWQIVNRRTWTHI